MKSRYDYMVDGQVVDIDNEYFPDPLSLNYVAFEPTQPMDPVDLSTEGIKKFWWVVQRTYGEPSFLDDIILTLNGALHRNFLKEGDILFIPIKDDIENSFSKDT